MFKARVTYWIVVSALAFSALALAAPAPPPASPPEVASPCDFELPAEWLVPLKHLSAKSVRSKVPKPVNCEGAVISEISATGKESVTTLDFAVAYKPGHDRAAYVAYAIIDENNRAVGTGEVQATLVAGTTTRVKGNFTMKSREFDRVFESGKPPILRVTVRMGRQ
jgi:hypothetical protein